MTTKPTELTPFAFQTHMLRVQADEHGNPWFCAKDACDILGYANDSDAIKQHCKPDGVAKRYPIVDSLGRTQYPNFLSEGNLYRLIVKSNKPEAEPFEAWVCDDVLPSIRKTGRYVAQPEAIKSIPKSKKALPGCLTLDMQDEVKALVRGRAESLPDKKLWGGAAIRMWSAVKSHFGCTYKQVPAEHFSEVLSLVARVDLVGEVIVSDDARTLCGRRLLVKFREDGTYWAEEVPEKAHVMTLDSYEEVLGKTGYSIVPTAAIEAIAKALKG